MPCSDDQHWDKINEQDGVTTFSRKEASKTLLSLKGVGRINSSSQRLIQLMRDPQSVSKWMPYLESKEVLKELSNDHRITLSLIRMPWPVKLRVIVSEEILSQPAANQTLVEMRSVEFPFKLDEDAIVAKIYYSNFRLRSINKNQTEVSVEINGDPNGLLPKWLVNIAQKDWPRQVILGLNRLVK